MSRRVINTKSNKVSTFLTTEVQPDENPPTPLTAKNTAGPTTLTTSPQSIVSVTTPAFSSAQHALITVTCEYDTSGGNQDQVTFGIYDGVVTNNIDEYHQTVGVATSEGNVQDTTGATTLVAGNGGARTFGLQAFEFSAGLVTVPANGARIVVQILDS